jgi:hypothetical protein
MEVLKAWPVWGVVALLVLLGVLVPADPADAGQLQGKMLLSITPGVYPLAFCSSLPYLEHF